MRTVEAPPTVKTMFEVYVITNLVNGKQYVGKARNAQRRWWDHCARVNYGSTCAIHRAIRKYGRDAFTVEVLERTDTESAAFEAERGHIVRLRTNEHGYNMTEGGEGCSGYRHTPESLKKMGAVHRGQVWTAEQRARMSEALRGRVLTPEHCAAISAAKMGKHVSQETRAKLAAAARGKTLSQEAKTKVGAASKARPRRRWTEEEKARQSALIRGKMLARRMRVDAVQMEMF